MHYGVTTNWSSLSSCLSTCRKSSSLSSGNVYITSLVRTLQVRFDSTQKFQDILEKGSDLLLFHSVGFQSPQFQVLHVHAQRNTTSGYIQNNSPIRSRICSADPCCHCDVEIFDRELSNDEDLGYQQVPKIIDQGRSRLFRRVRPTCL